MPDIRWQRVDIKSVALLPNVLAKQAAREQGASEAWLVDANGFVTEGASSNAWIVHTRRHADHPAARHRHPARHHPLGGARPDRGARASSFEERAFTVEEAYAAREAFVTSASQIVMPVVDIDGRPVGNGAPGLVASALAARLSRPGRLQLTGLPPSRWKREISSENATKIVIYFSDLPHCTRTSACTRGQPAI